MTKPTRPDPDALEPFLISGCVTYISYVADCH